MKNTIINFFEKSSQNKVQNLKRRSAISRMALEEMNEMEYNPKTARHKSLKGIGFRPNN